MTRGNSLLDCPNCLTRTLTVEASDVDENNIGMRLYICSDCRNRFTFVETLLSDPDGNVDCFNNLSLNIKLKDREKRQRRTGIPPRRQLKPTDLIVAVRNNGSVSLRYHKNPEVRMLFFKCKNGHLLEGDNVYTNPNSGSRCCKPCRRAYQSGWGKENRRRG